MTPLPFLTAEEMITGIPNPNGGAAYNPGSAETVKQPKEEVRRTLHLYALGYCIFLLLNKCARASERAIPIRYSQLSACTLLLYSGRVFKV